MNCYSSFDRGNQTQPTSTTYIPAYRIFSNRSRPQIQAAVLIKKQEIEANLIYNIKFQAMTPGVLITELVPY